MNAKTTISISEARKKIFDIASEVQCPGIYYTFTEKGKPKAVVMGVEEFESWAETLEVIKDFPDIKKDVTQANKEHKSGDYISLTDLLKKKNALRSNSAKKSSKGTK